jgi:hypothetical protein
MEDKEMKGMVTSVSDLIDAMKVHSTTMIALTIALGMNSDNCIAQIKDEMPPYAGEEYIKMLKTLKLIDVIKVDRRN